MPKLIWFESYTTICKFSAEITEEQAKLFNENPDLFFEKVNYQDDQNLEWDKIEDEKWYDYQIEGE
jgi:hypothetical protein